MSIIFSDIDGTIYGTKRKIHKDLKANIKEAKNASVMFNIATGNGVLPHIEELGKELGVKYIINSSGACIYDVVEDKIIYKNMISKEAGSKILEIANKYELGVDWWDEIKLAYNSKEQIESNLIEASKITGDIFKIEFYDKNIAKLNSAYEELIKLDLEVVRMHATHIEITNAKVSKAHAIKIICKKHNVDPKKVMTIGDSANDATMLGLTDYSYAVSNAPQNIKDIAKFNTSAYNQNGLGMAIIDFLHRI